MRTFFLSLFFLVPSIAFADDFSAAKLALKKRQYEKAAQLFYQSSKHTRSEKKLESLAYTARVLDKLQDKLTEKYEKKCYWGKSAPETPQCMKNGAQELNRLYGKNAFRYIGGTGVEFIEYTGQHYKDLLRSSKKSEFAGEAHFYLLLQNLQGEPDQVLKRVNKFLKKYPEGTWNARGKLLFARVNDDIYNMWKESAWVIYNGELSNAEVDNKAEPYRLAAIKTLSQLKQSHKGTFAGQAAARDLRKIQTNGSDGALYSISNEASVGTWEKWGIRLRE